MRALNLSRLRYNKTDIEKYAWSHRTDRTPFVAQRDFSFQHVQPPYTAEIMSLV